MLGILKKIFSTGPQTNYSELVKNGAKIIDVRSANEFKSGHVKGAVNIPLQTLQSKLTKLPKDQVIITCCASGMRSASAKGILTSNGFKQVYNGGGWMNLQNKLNQ